ncbi:MAG: DUF2141 domain-containing protein [Hydrotalea flava]|uniref:DUF2141 domain-containing protein n=1 Tax=Hydrotalea TaxID=1004300 RepID=UPI0009BEEF91|nr:MULTISPECIES: DUF2141 domain-containing protein [Hydrotalea]MBY0349037.1 DUF2141 domain-containing protein [Hydrotalea flava]NIM36548.1 DUF2141 domain-containing protein [Hydrotalea flava]NIM39408.1 DUF2141 domain-containing protein [Hydrotalea flava]NIN04597.1 DUF2141 domain-containing protein [Hydrotalea flava]NIN16269.1 DUF2141 domain-containing protein [Hydrotalea flava]
MKKLFIHNFVILAGILSFFIFSSFKEHYKYPTFSLTVEVSNLRNNGGSVVFALYNREDAFPDEHYKKYYKKIVGKIDNKKSSVTFEDLPAGKYAVSILHDEDNNGKIKKGFILPKEGIGFSNYQSIGLGNKPTFSKASFEINSNLEIKLKMIYM